MGSDGMPVGRVITRREALALAGAAVLARGVPSLAQDRPVCVARPQQAEGPFFVDTVRGRGLVATFDVALQAG